MVSNTGDIPPKDEVTPEEGSMSNFLRDLLESGEVQVTLTDGSSYELHGHDTYVFETTAYTKSNDDDIWFFLAEVVSVTRHYE